MDVNLNNVDVEEGESESGFGVFVVIVWGYLFGVF